MAVLPGAIIGELLERLNAERRRVVLDGFEPHADEWSRTWSGRRGTGSRGSSGRDGAAEAEVLDRIADDLRVEEPGQPTAAEIVVILTSAIRRDPERATITVDAMLADYPKMAVVIVATALRVCPGLRKEILTTARRHKPFSRHPFILGILLALVAKILADNGAEAAESFEGLETPSEILAALGRHYSTSRPGTGEGGGRDANRALGFGPLVTPAFVATVLAAGDALSRTLPAEPAQDQQSGMENKAGGTAEAAAGSTGGGVELLDGGPGDDRLHHAARPGEAPEEHADAAPPVTFQADRAAEADALAAPTPAPPRAMVAAAPVGQAHAANLPAVPGPADAATASPSDPTGIAPTAGESAAVAELFDLVLQKLAGTDTAGTVVDGLLHELADVLAADVDQTADVGPTAALRQATAPDQPVSVEQTAAMPPASHSPTPMSAGLPVIAEATPPGAAEPLVVEPSIDLDILGPDSVLAAEAGSDLSVGEIVTVEVDAAAGALVDEGVVVVLDADMAVGEAISTATALDLGLLTDEAVLTTDLELSAGVGDFASAELDTSVAILNGPAVAEVALDLDASLGEADLAVAADLSLLDEGGLANAEVGAEIALGDAVVAEVEADVALLDGGTVAELDLGADVGIAGVADVAAAAGIELLGDEGVAQLAVDAEIALGDAVLAEVEADVALLDGDTVAEVNLGADVGIAGVADVAAVAGIALLGDEGVADVELEAAVDLGDTVSADADVGLAILGEAATVQAEIDVGGSLGGVTDVGVDADVELVGDGGPTIDLQSELVVDDLLSVDIGMSPDDGLDIELDLLPGEEIPVVDDVVEAVEDVVGGVGDGLLGLLGGSSEPEEQEPPPPPPGNPVQSVLFSLGGGLFG